MSKAFWCQLEKAEKPTFWRDSIQFDERKNLLEIAEHRIKTPVVKKGWFGFERTYLDVSRVACIKIRVFDKEKGMFHSAEIYDPEKVAEITERIKKVREEYEEKSLNSLLC